MIQKWMFRPIAVVLGSLGLVAVGTGTATADAPEPFYNPPKTVTFTDACPFPVSLTYSLEGIFKDSIDPATNTGTLTAEYNEYDAWSANGVTLQGTPFHVHYRATLVNGESTVDVSTGIGVRVPLPDGTTFKTAGLVDYRAGDFFVQVTHGNVQNLDAFCAALS